MCRMVGGRRIRVGHSDTKARAFLMVMVEGYEGERRRDQAPSLSFPWQLVFFHSGSQVPSKSGTLTLPASPAPTLFSEMKAHLPNHLGTWTLVYGCVCWLAAGSWRPEPYHRVYLGVLHQDQALHRRQLLWAYYFKQN